MDSRLRLMLTHRGFSLLFSSECLLTLPKRCVCSVFCSVEIAKRVRREKRRLNSNYIFRREQRLQSSIVNKQPTTTMAAPPFTPTVYIIFSRTSRTTTMRCNIPRNGPVRGGGGAAAGLWLLLLASSSLLLVATAAAAAATTTTSTAAATDAAAKASIIKEFARAAARRRRTARAHEESTAKLPPPRRDELFERVKRLRDTTADAGARVVFEEKKRSSIQQISASISDVRSSRIREIFLNGQKKKQERQQQQYEDRVDVDDFQNDRLRDLQQSIFCGVLETDGSGFCVLEDPNDNPNLVTVLLGCPVINGEVDEFNLSNCLFCASYESESFEVWDPDLSTQCDSCSVCASGSGGLVAFECGNTFAAAVSCDCDGECSAVDVGSPPTSPAVPTAPVFAPSPPAFTASPVAVSLPTGPIPQVFGDENCVVTEDGTGGCIKEDIYGYPNLLAILFYCPVLPENVEVDVTRLAECEVCSVNEADDTLDLTDETKACNSCTVCASGLPSFDCTSKYLMLSVHLNRGLDQSKPRTQTSEYYCRSHHPPLYLLLFAYVFQTPSTTYLVTATDPALPDRELLQLPRRSFLPWRRRPRHLFRKQRRRSPARRRRATWGMLIFVPFLIAEVVRAW